MTEKPHNQTLTAQPTPAPPARILLHILLPVLVVAFLVVAGQGLVELMGKFIVWVKKWWPYSPDFMIFCLFVLMRLLFAPLDLIHLRKNRAPGPAWSWLEKFEMRPQGEALRFTLLVPVLEVVLMITLERSIVLRAIPWGDDAPFYILVILCLIIIVVGLLGESLFSTIAGWLFSRVTEVPDTSRFPTSHLEAIAGWLFSRMTNTSRARRGLITTGRYSLFPLLVKKYFVCLAGVLAGLYFYGGTDFLLLSLMAFVATRSLFAGPLLFISFWLDYRNQPDNLGMNRYKPALAERFMSALAVGVLLMIALSVGVVALVGYTIPRSFEIAKLPQFEFVYIPAGKFMMGAANGESDEKPVHEVILSQTFEMGKYEVTQAQWKAVMGRLPDKCDYGALTDELAGDDKPVICVSWDETQEFIARLNVAQVTYKYRLPTEAEWEYAARAGTTGDYGGTGKLDEMGWYEGNSGRATHPVGQKQPNAWGLYDIHGNVWEWCEDWYGPYPDASTPEQAVTDPSGPTSGSFRVRRGGSWDNKAAYCRSAQRINYGGPVIRNYGLGFRLVRTPA